MIPNTFTKELATMTLPVAAAYSLLVLIVSTFIQIIVSGLFLPRLQAWSRARAMDVVVRFRHAYSQGLLDIDAGLYGVVNQAMTDMMRDANHLALPMLIQDRPVLAKGTPAAGSTIQSVMERHPDENVRTFHREWAEVILTVMLANSSSAVVNLTLLVLLFSPLILIVGIWKVVRQPTIQPSPAVMVAWIVGFVTRDSRAIYGNAWSVMPHESRMIRSA